MLLVGAAADADTKEKPSISSSSSVAASEGALSPVMLLLVPLSVLPVGGTSEWKGSALASAWVLLPLRSSPGSAAPAELTNDEADDEEVKGESEAAAGRGAWGTGGRPMANGSSGAGAATAVDATGATVVRGAEEKAPKSSSSGPVLLLPPVPVPGEGEEAAAAGVVPRGAAVAPRENAAGGMTIGMCIDMGIPKGCG